MQAKTTGNDHAVMITNNWTIDELIINYEEKADKQENLLVNTSDHHEMQTISFLTMQGDYF